MCNNSHGNGRFQLGIPICDPIKVPSINTSRHFKIASGYALGFGIIKNYYRLFQFIYSSSKSFTMVTISAYHTRQNQEGKQFVTLELSGDVELIQSSTTGAFYATAKRCTISSTFSEDVAKTLIGKQLPGRIERVQCEPYEYTNKETEEVMMLTHTYTYNPDEKESMQGSDSQRVLVGA
jgi:hypothetical protein